MSPIRYRTEVTLTSGEMDGLRAAVARFRPGFANARAVSLGGVSFSEGAEPGVRTHAHEGDLAEVVAVVEEASRQADWVLVTSHSHEGAGDRFVPADFLVEVARAVIDAGADMFVGHGPHVIRGVEIYRDRPIFYSLANFIFQNETVELQPQDNYEGQGLGFEDLPGRFQDTRIERMGMRAFPADPAFWESFVPVVEFAGGELSEVRLYPITLGHGLPRAVRGRPILADAEHGGRVLTQLAELSRPFGTTISVEDGVGVIRP